MKICSVKKKIIIAIDGYSSCGKSTFAKSIARELQYVYVDTGAMYRAVALYATNQGLVENNEVNENGLLQQLGRIGISFQYNKENGKSETLLNGENVEKEIRKEKISKLVSRVSAIKQVRQKLVQLQQEMGKNKGIVMDGRDIGTVVFPKAELKIFMTASSRVRAQRRHNELIGKGENADLDEVEKDLVRRDHLDMTRKESPLMKAEDALELNNSHMDVGAQMEWFREIFQNKSFANNTGSTLQ
jgi:CMP/dCMP kinase